MSNQFRFSNAITASLLALGAVAVLLGLAYLRLSIILGGVGIFAIIVVWFKVAIRTRRWFWWQFADVPLTHTEGLVAASGVALFAATMLTVILYSIYHAA